MNHDDAVPVEVDVLTVARWIQEEQKLLLLDVREREEYDVARIDGSMLVPMSELRERIDELAPYRDQHIVVHCHHGGRSLRVTELLRAQGYTNVQNMAGGIDDWSQQIDPSVPRY